MAFDSTVQSVWTFNQTLEDQVQNNDFADPLLSVPEYTSYQQYDLASDKIKTKYGLKFQEDKIYTAGSGFSFVTTTYRISIGFWWFSPGPVGFIRHASTRNLTTKIAPILAKAESSISGGIETVSSAEWIISEVASTSKKNAIRFSLCTAGTNPTHIFESDSYETGLHHVFINYKSVDSTEGFVRIDIDGKYGKQHSAPGGLTQSAGVMRLNDIGYEETAHKTTQENAFISDLVLRTSASISSIDSIKMYRYGWEYIADSDLSSLDFRYFGTGYKQSSTVNTNQIYVEGGNIYVARSNGELLKGLRPNWDRQFLYESKESIRFLNISKQDPEGEGGNTPRKAEWTTSGLSLKGVVVKV